MIQRITSTNGAANRNPGIVPPWLDEPQSKNPGIVPPWLTESESKNPGIVPPWLLEPIHTLPVDQDEEFHILPVNGETQFVPELVDASPASLADVLRGR